MQMDICPHIGFSVNDVNSLHGSCADTLRSSYEPVGDFLVDGLAYGATKILNIQVDVEHVSVSIPPHKKDVVQMKNEHSGVHQSVIITEAQENDDDVVTSEAVAHGDGAKFVDSHCSSAPYLPERMKPVSAMKGSREKHGLSSPKQLTVKWAPDVYDPVPASSLHMVINRPHKNGKKKSKSKQKSRSKSRGSKGKDEKQAGKNMSFKLCEHKEEVIRVSEIKQQSGIDFLPGFPDGFGGGFVDLHGLSLHLS